MCVGGGEAGLGGYRFGKTSLGSKVPLGVSWFLGHLNRAHSIDLPGTGRLSV